MARFKRKSIIKSIKLICLTVGLLLFAVMVASGIQFGVLQMTGRIIGGVGLTCIALAFFAEVFW